MKQSALPFGPSATQVEAAYDALRRLPFGSPERLAAARFVQASCSAAGVEPLAAANAWWKSGFATHAGRTWAAAVARAAERARL